MCNDQTGVIWSVCTRTWAHTRVCMHSCVCMCGVCTNVCMPMSLCTHVCGVCMHVYVHVCVRSCVHARACACACVYMCGCLSSLSISFFETRYLTKSGAHCVS